jgi:hypothetical protein
MTVSQHPFESTDESYDEQEAKHRFESALRGAREAAHQLIESMTRKREKKHAVSKGGGAGRKAQ